MTPTSAIQRVRFGPFELNLQSGELLQNGRKVRLQGQSFQILQLLLERPGVVVTREELQRALWPDDTFVDFDSGLNNAVKRLRESLGDTAAKPRFIETLPRRGYRFLSRVSTAETASGEVLAPPAVTPGAPGVEMAAVSVEAPAIRIGDERPYRTPLRLRWALFLALLAVGGVVAYLVNPRKVQTFTTKDKIVLGEFTNKTADPVFDETLRRGLAVELEQSPLLSVVSEERVQQVLKLMTQPAETQLTLAIAREVCERSAGTAVVDGSISAVGGQYVLWVRATS